MSAPAWENLNEFLQPESAGGFAKRASFMAGDQTKQIWVHFDDPAVTARLAGYEADASEPRIAGSAQDFAGITRKTLITIDGLGDFYATANPLQDGTGWAIVELARKTQHGQP